MDLLGLARQVGTSARSLAWRVSAVAVRLALDGQARQVWAVEDGLGGDGSARRGPARRGGHGKAPTAWQGGAWHGAAVTAWPG